MLSFLRVISSLHWKEKVLNRLVDFLESLSDDQARNYIEQIKIFNAKEKEDLYTEDFCKNLGNVNPLDFILKKFEEVETDDLLGKLLYVDINSYLPEDLLVKMDIATMANSLEARVPFLDHELMEFVAGIPSHLKLKGSMTKFILKKTFSNLLPRAILKERKWVLRFPSQDGSEKS